MATGFEFRTLAADELRTAYTLFRATMHDRPATDEAWQVMRRAYDETRTISAFANGTMVGTASSLPSSLTVPGGRTLPMAAVTYVGVRSDHRRRGALTGMMRAQLTSLAEAGETLAALHASEPMIYGRYGYGLATLSRMIQVRDGELRPEVPTAGTVRQLTDDEALSALPEAYDRLRGTRVGMIGRAPLWWALGYERRLKMEHFVVAAHYDSTDTIDGWAGYAPRWDESAGHRAHWKLDVVDFQAANQGVANDLWRYLLGVDLIDEVAVYNRPLNDPLELLLANAHAATSELGDEVWLRLVDVPTALATRTYGDADPVVIEVVDGLLTNNSGNYRISPQGTERTSATPELTLSVEALGMLYLGTWRASTLAAIGRIEATSPAALSSADRLFATDHPACCGTMF